MKQKWVKIKAIIREWFILIVMFIPVSLLLAYGIVNRDSMSTAGWALLIGIVLSLVLFAFALTKARREGFTGRWVAVLIFSVGGLFILYLVYNLQQIEPVDWVQIMLMLALVAVTLFSTMSAIRQANASVKMAEEVKEQRYDAVRPVIDIQRDIDVADVARQTLEANAALSKDTSHGLSCILHNIGVGPAIDVHSFIQHPERGRLPWNFVTLAAGGKTERKIFSLKHENNRMALVAYYKDIYDQVFESSREVSIDKLGNAKWEIGPLKTIPVKEVENND